MLAAVACGEYKDVVEAASSIVKVVETIEPDTELVDKYEKKYETFRKIYPDIKGIFQIM